MKFEKFVESILAAKDKAAVENLACGFRIAADMGTITREQERLLARVADLALAKFKFAEILNGLQ